jgi:proline dehydrogenase
MGIARATLLWASKNQWLERQFQQRAFARRAIRRFMPGESAEDALDAASAFNGDGIPTLFTMLGENVSGETEAEAVVEQYADLLGHIQQRNLAAQISVKPTQLGLDLSTDLCSAQLDALLQAAQDRGNFVWVDMEGSAYLDRTFDLHERARRSHDNVGLCIQSYLHRTAEDLERLIALGAAVRVVKGAYNEPASIAIQNKREVDANFLALSLRLLEARQEGRIGLPAFGTHDMRLITQIQAAASEMDLARASFELEMLYGIGREHQRRLAADGYQIRVLISYGSAWYPWYVRRLAERPANVWFVVKSVLPR